MLLLILLQNTMVIPIIMAKIQDCRRQEALKKTGDDPVLNDELGPLSTNPRPPKSNNSNKQTNRKTPHWNYLKGISGETSEKWERKHGFSKCLHTLPTSTKLNWYVTNTHVKKFCIALCSYKLKKLLMYFPVLVFFSHPNTFKLEY